MVPTVPSPIPSPLPPPPSPTPLNPSPPAAPLDTPAPQMLPPADFLSLGAILSRAASAGPERVSTGASSGSSGNEATGATGTDGGSVLAMGGASGSSGNEVRAAVFGPAGREVTGSGPGDDFEHALSAARKEHATSHPDRFMPPSSPAGLRK